MNPNEREDYPNENENDPYDMKSELVEKDNDPSEKKIDPGDEESGLYGLEYVSNQQWASSANPTGLRLTRKGEATV